jgi:hypothetical protein
LRTKIHERSKGCLRWGINPLAALFFLLALYGGVRSQTPEDTLSPSPPSEVTAFDTPNDAGGSITVTWSKSPDDGAGANNVKDYEILRAISPESTYAEVGWVPAGTQKYIDKRVKDGIKYYYIVKAKSETSSSDSKPPIAAMASGQLFNTDRVNVLLFVVFYAGLLLWFISGAKKGKTLFVRRIAGLDAVDEAIGRATEMGKPILYIPGLSTISDVATLASLNILGCVARKTATYETRIIIPNRNPIVMPVCQEVVKAAYLDAGRPDAYKENDIFYVTYSQFGYTAAVDGIMMREKPATNFFLGMFWAESLVLAETGASTGAIQIAGTDAVHQLPFFITACDYTLIGEELYAASAYLSREPLSLGSLKGQDWAKFIIGALIILGIALATSGFTAFAEFFAAH